MAVASLFEELLDQYKIEQHLAEKRYTDLYQAYDVDDDRLVQLDIVRPGLTEDGGFAGRFVNRARAVAQVRHPNIASIYHIGKTADGRPYVAQASIDGLPLSQRLEQLAQRDAPVNALYALKLVRQLADALVLGERLELLHYDLQPDNVWLKNVALPSDESLVLLDLFMPPDPRPPAPDDRDAYRPPERRAGREVTPAGHVYTLGVLLYQLLSGQLPAGPVTWRAATPGLRTRASSLERARPGLSRQTYDLVERCLRREPGRRYESVEAFVVALDGALAAEEGRLGVAVVPPAESSRALGWLLSLVILVLVITTAVLAARWQRQSALAAPTTAVAAYPADLVASPTPVMPTTAPTTAPNSVSETATVVLVAPTSEPPVAPTTPLSPTATPPSPTPTPTAPPPTALLTTAPTRVPVVRVTLNEINLRRGPGVVYNTVGRVRGGATLQVLAWNDDAGNPWFLVLTADQRMGWVSADVVEAEDAAALAGVPAAATLPPTPFPTSTPPPLPTATPVTTLTAPTADPGDDLGGPDDPGDEEPPQPTAEPTEPPEEPTPTPPPLP